MYPLKELISNNFFGVDLLWFVVAIFRGNFYIYSLIWLFGTLLATGNEFHENICSSKTSFARSKTTRKLYVAWATLPTLTNKDPLSSQWSDVLKWSWNTICAYLYTVHAKTYTRSARFVCFLWICIRLFNLYYSGIIHSYECPGAKDTLQYIPRNMHTVFALLCFVVVIHWLIFPYPSGLLHWHCGNLTIAPVPAKQPWYIWINTSCECIMNDCITTTKQSTTKPCAYFLGYTVLQYMG